MKFTGLFLKTLVAVSLVQALPGPAVVGDDGKSSSKSSGHSLNKSHSSIATSRSAPQTTSDRTTVTGRPTHSIRPSTATSPTLSSRTSTTPSSARSSQPSTATPSTLSSRTSTKTSASSTEKAEPTCAKADCGAVKDDSKPEIAKRLWDESCAGVLADDYINKNTREDWVQNFDEDLFVNDPSDSADCFAAHTVCELDHSCAEYNNIDKGGAYWLYYSIQQASAYLAELESQLFYETVINSLSVSTIITDFRHPQDEDPNLNFILAAIFGMVAGAAAKNTGVSGFAGVLGGMNALVANLEKAEPPPEDEWEYESRLEELLKATLIKSTGQIKKIRAIVFGEPDAPDQSSLPKEMQKQSFDNPIVNFFGDGQWIVEHAADESLDEAMKEFSFRMKQALAWSMVRFGRKASVVINTDVKPEDCGSESDDPDAVYDEERGECFNLFVVDDSGNLNDADHGSLAKKLWNEESGYNLDKLETYRNAYDCWMEHDGDISNLPPPEIPSAGSVPACFFAARVVKGSFERENDCSLPPSVILDTDFPGQSEGGHWNGNNVFPESEYCPT